MFLAFGNGRPRTQISSLLSGVAIQAANGSTKAELKRTAAVALRHLGIER